MRGEGKSEGRGKGVRGEGVTGRGRIKWGV